ncbi:class I SAM-dependent methyltransferase [Nocardioides sp. AE5]|uniref:class I SAM-dependent methyltransferase n=1 Tax=Nocardioides sp. AE5 TaxID=2962573 RepID=UPI00288223B7|nr:class I SAM-dependent methyltransferase [Nocardioides sp. AE5]MDT0201859.1 class I SAM-dependent methyltransferase [Nocardioides sp. AE5]
MKRVYVAGLRALRSVLATLGLLGLLDRWAARSRTGMWVRSWFSIYDLADLLPHDTPWWTFASADQVEWFLATRPGARVFEWGSGASTVWLGKRAGQVHSVEHDAAWAATMREVLPDNATLTVVEPVRRPGGLRAGDQASAKPGFEGLDFTDYVAAIDDVPGDFDLVVIDGRAREACLARAVERLAPGGLIVFDNVDRERYRDAIAALGDRVATTWTRGRTPSLPYPTRTALLSVPEPAER